MNTKELLSAIEKKGYKANIVRTFTYSICKDKDFNLVTIDESPNMELIRIANEFKCMWVAETHVKIVGDKPEYSIKYSAYPKNMKDFEFCKQ